MEGGRWLELGEQGWSALPELAAGRDGEFKLPDGKGQPVTIPIPWREVIQVLRAKDRVWLATAADPYELAEGRARSLGWPSRYRVNQVAVAPDSALWLASNAGLFRQTARGWEQERAVDGSGRAWGVDDVLGIAVDGSGRAWFACKAGVAVQGEKGWRFFEGKDGLPWNEFTGIAAGTQGDMWFGTRLGLIRFDGKDWHYRQGPRWLPNDEVRQILAGGDGSVVAATAGGLGRIEFRPMTLAEKATLYEGEIQRYVKRTPYGFVAEAPLGKPADRSTANPQDSDNDGLWTAMYGAGECFAVGATGDHGARTRAKQAFEALRFLQVVTQGGEHPAPKGFVARSIRSTELPDPNVGGLASDRESQKHDKLWKAYEPRWPRSADGKWYWKSDTSSDELDGHFFFYPLYHDLCADTPAEKERVREVVKNLADHFLEHGFLFVDHDGRPTRWGIYSPQELNSNPLWWAERGLNSLSMLSYLAVATHVTGDPKYETASRELIERHGYAQNAMFTKVQYGPGSGNQSDDEMAFMCYYSLLRYSRNEALKTQIRYSFFSYWSNERAELNPFFNFAFAAQNLGTAITNTWGAYPVGPWPGWLEDSRATLHGFPLDRLNWSHRNSHRLDLIRLGQQQAKDLYEPERSARGHRVNGKVLPVENRHFGHWNTDPWDLDYHGNASELSAGTVFLLPYYMGLYHGYIAKP